MNYRENYLSQKIVGVSELSIRDLSESGNYRILRTVRVSKLFKSENYPSGELSESENCKSQRIIQKLQKSQIAKPAANKIEYRIPFETF